MVRTLCFGPWDGGMVNATLKEMFEKQGVQVIPREGGAESTSALMVMHGPERTQCLVGNWKVPPTAPVDAKQKVTWTVSPGSNMFLESHLIQGKRVLPMTIAVAEIAAVVSRMHPGW